ncbi:MAG TPA: protein phosphatase 2C domain-containing protein [Opitutaceae bacterium]|nr:protein phosphatase 2C domain-containing protein [Opitutaceae bacterium]HRJ46789.1 protein phosphatase 2C domain-containing protein [Opitutaceae bacterium]
MSPETNPPPPCRLRWSAMTHRGRVRPNNEDAFLALNFDGHELRFLGKTGEASARKTDFVFAVSDGMGGANSGEFASRIAVDHITKLMPKSFRMAAMGLASGFTDVLLELFTDIHQVMLRHGRSYEECAGMGATLSLCWLTPQWLYFGHLGDSRIYYLPREGGFTQLTNDHSHVGWLRRQGKINEREARSHPLRNALNQALGAGHQFIDPQVGAVGYQPGDRFLICSDGLTDGLWDRALHDLLREPDPAAAAKDPARRLVEASLEASGRDNITAIVIETEAEPAP